MAYIGKRPIDTFPATNAVITNLIADNAVTSVKIADSITEIENEIGVPVTSSNHALAWHCLRLAGINDLIPESGKLFQTTL